MDQKAVELSPVAPQASEKRMRRMSLVANPQRQKRDKAAPIQVINDDRT